MQKFVEKNLLTAEALLKELGLDLQNALEVSYVISFRTTFGYDAKQNTSGTLVVRATSMYIHSGSICFSFSKIEPKPTIDVKGDNEDSFDLSSGSLHITGITYFGKGAWCLDGEFDDPQDPTLDEYFSTKEGTLMVKILKEGNK